MKHTTQKHLVAILNKIAEILDGYSDRYFFHKFIIALSNAYVKIDEREARQNTFEYCFKKDIVSGQYIFDFDIIKKLSSDLIFNFFQYHIKYNFYGFLKLTMIKDSIVFMNNKTREIYAIFDVTSRVLIPGQIDTVFKEQIECMIEDYISILDGIK